MSEPNNVTSKIAVGLEYWEFNAGIGLGLTPSTDRLIIKMILAYRFDWAGGGRK